MKDCGHINIEGTIKCRFLIGIWGVRKARKLMWSCIMCRFLFATEHIAGSCTRVSTMKLWGRPKQGWTTSPGVSLRIWFRHAKMGSSTYYLRKYLGMMRRFFSQTTCTLGQWKCAMPHCGPQGRRRSGSDGHAGICGTNWIRDTRSLHAAHLLWNR